MKDVNHFAESQSGAMDAHKSRGSFGVNGQNPAKQDPVGVYYDGKGLKGLKGPTFFSASTLDTVRARAKDNDADSVEHT
jgi:hypothetical protein